MQPELGPWEPMTPAEVTELLATLDCPWWIAGGWAIDLYLGHQTRDHDDIDVLVLRADLPAVQHALSGWDLHAADPPGTLRPWAAGEWLPETVHDIWCRRTSTSAWSLQLMVDDASDGVWSYRRDRRVQRPVTELAGPASDASRMVLAPEVQLLQKSKHPRDKDEADFLVAVPSLTDAQRHWLTAALRLTAPGHPWLMRL